MIIFPPSPQLGDVWTDRESGTTFWYTGSLWEIQHLGTPWAITEDLLPYLRSLDGTLPPSGIASLDEIGDVSYSLPLKSGEILVYDDSLGQFTNRTDFRTHAVSSVEILDISSPPFNMVYNGNGKYIGDLSGNTFDGVPIVLGNRYLLTNSPQNGIFTAIDDGGILQLEIADSFVGGELIYDYNRDRLWVTLMPGPTFALVSTITAADSSLNIVGQLASVNVSNDSKNILELRGDGLYVDGNVRTFTFHASTFSTLSSNQFLRRVDGTFTNVVPFITPYDSTIYMVTAENAVDDISQEWTLEVHVNAVIQLSVTVPNTDYRAFNDFPVNISKNDRISFFFSNASAPITNPSCVLYAIER